MEAFTRALWAKQDQHTGDRQRLFAAVADAVDATAVLYPGSFADVAASFAFPDVTYVDVDARAARFFADTAGVREIIDSHRPAGADPPGVRFVHGSYTHPLDLADGSVDLLVSLYAGFVSEHCTRYLRVGGALLVNPSHGDVAMASIDHRYRLDAVVLSGSGRYRVDRDVAGYLIPRKEQPLTVELIHRLGRGVAYTRFPFAYLFTRVT